jgi:aspartate kinase
MAVLVMKFGGTSVKDVDHIKNVARHVAREAKAGHHCAVVVSAMSGQTNQLVSYVNEAGGDNSSAEYDAVVSSGEQVTAGLLSIVLNDMGIPARSWQGWQIPVRTNAAHGKARITDIAADNLEVSMADGTVAVIAGFQGLAEDGMIATLGRGGSDTSAVAIAAALKADRCDIYTDVDGVYTTDPRITPKAHKLDKISYEEMLEMASQGAKVLQTRSVEIAMKHKVRLSVRSSFDDPDKVPPAGNGDENRVGTLVCDEGEIVEKHIVNGIAYTKDEAKITLVHVADKPGIAAAIFVPLAKANINVDMIVQNISEDGKFTDMTFTVQDVDMQRTLEVIEQARATIDFDEVRSATNIVKLSVIGVGMSSHAGVAGDMFAALAEKGVNILAISTSEIKISVLIDADYTELAVRTLHTLYGLDKD